MRTGFISILVPALAAAAPAFAEDATEEAASIIVTAERDRRALPDVSGTRVFAGKWSDVGVLAERPPIPGRNLRAALHDIPGLLVSETSNGAWAALSYRGLGEPHESWNILTLIDAVPAVPDMYSYPAAYVIPPLELVERVEFVRGGSGLLYGPTPGGALNYVLRGPRRDPGTEAQARVTFGAFNQRGALARLATSNGTLAFDTHLDHTRTDGPRPNTDGEQWSGRARLALDTGGVRAAATLDLHRGDFGEPGGLSAARLADTPRAGSTPLDRIRLTRIAPQLTLDYDASDATLITARAWVSRFIRTSWRQAGGAFGQPTPAANVLIRQEQRFTTAALDVRVRHDAGAHVLTVGALAHTSDAPVAVDKGASPTDFAGSAGPLARAHRSGDAVALFGEALLDLGRLQLAPGFRLERLRQRVTETLDLGIGAATGGPPGAPNGPLGNRRDIATVALWGLGATYAVTPEFRLVANASRGFKPKLYNDGVTFQAGIDAAGDFAATYATTLEAGFEARPTPALRLDASLFRVTFADQVGFLAGPLPASPPFGALTAGNARRQNVGSMRNQGLDASVSLDALRADAGTLRLTAATQLLDARFTRGPAAGFRPQYAPRAMWRASATWIAANGGRAALLFTAVSSQNGSDNARPEFALAPYRVADASIEWPIAGRLFAGAGVNNIFDARYAPRVRPGAGGGYDPGLPRAAYISLALR